VVLEKADSLRSLDNERTRTDVMTTSKKSQHAYIEGHSDHVDAERSSYKPCAIDVEGWLGPVAAVYSVG
jgi:hypothetical protein